MFPKLSYLIYYTVNPRYMHIEYVARVFCDVVLHDQMSWKSEFNINISFAFIFHI